jgi:hypothetical protein
MELRLNSQMAAIGLNISRPAIILNSTQPRIEIDTRPALMEIESPKPKMDIDQTQCFADESHRGLLDFALYCSEYSRSEYFKGLERTVAEGNNLAAIQTGFSVADLGYASLPEKNNFEIVSVPSQLPRIEVDVQPVSYRFTPSQVTVQAIDGRIENNFQRGKVEVYIARPNSLDIQWIDDRVLDVRV